MTTAPVFFPLLHKWPDLATNLPRVAFTSLPTSLERLERLEQTLASPVPLFVKRDDRCASAMGGNKVRKLEFLLARARANGAKSVITVGAAGSNHALATATLCRQIGLRCVLMLYPQVNGHAVRRNLLADLATGARICPFNDYADHQAHLQTLIETYRAEDRTSPYVIPAGGSAPLGVVGYVNAGMELAVQFTAQAVTAPHIYCAMGTMGTAVGLQIGLRAAQCPARVTGVRVVPAFLASHQRAHALAAQTIELLRTADPSFPQLSAAECTPDIDESQFGGEYARFTPAGMEAVRVARQAAGLDLDGTYTGKAFAAVLKAVRERTGDNPIVFVNTRNSQPVIVLGNADYHQLPSPLWSHFEHDVQELDRA